MLYVETLEANAICRPRQLLDRGCAEREAQDTEQLVNSITDCHARIPPNNLSAPISAQHLVYDLVQCMGCACRYNAIVSRRHYLHKYTTPSALVRLRSNMSITMYLMSLTTLRHRRSPVNPRACGVSPRMRGRGSTS